MTGRAGVLVVLLVTAGVAAIAVALWPDRSPAPAGGQDPAVAVSPRAPAEEPIPGAAGNGSGIAPDDGRAVSGPADGEEATANRLSCLADIVAARIRIGGDQGPDDRLRLVALEQSTDPDHLFAAMHLTFSDPEQFWMLHERAERLLPGDDRRTLLAALQCLRTESPSCPPGFFAEQLHRDQANGALWLLASLHALSIGNREDAAAYMDMAASLDSYSDYTIASVDAVHSSLGVATALSHAERALAGFLVAGEPFANVRLQMAAACGIEAGASPAWAEHCERLGRNLVGQRRSLVFRDLGVRVLGSVASHGDEHKHAELEALRTQSREEIDRLAGSTASALQLAMIDEAQFARLVELNQELGDYEAFRAYGEEAEALLADPDYRPCEGVTLPR